MRVPPLLLLSLCAATAFADEESRPPYWGYSGPAQWKHLTIKDKTNECGGATQSPIKLRKLPAEQGPVITVKYTKGDANIENSGYDIRVKPTGAAGGITIDGKDYSLDNFHFHTPSEHRIPGVKAAAAAEIHFVHKREEGKEKEKKTYYAVIGVMLTAGVEDKADAADKALIKALIQVFDNLPLKECKVPAKDFAFDTLLPGELPIYYTYGGSLTTPPCTQGVNWYVLDKARPILKERLTKLEDLGKNARPIQTNQPPVPVKYIRPK